MYQITNKPVTNTPRVKVHAQLVWRDVWIILAAALAAGVSGALMLAMLVILLSTTAQAASISGTHPGSGDWQRGRGQQAELLVRDLNASRTVRLAPMLETDIQVDVSGMLLRARVRQQFQNRSEQWVEGIYVFPVPEGAAVDRMRLRYGERVIEAEIKEKREAKQIYAKAKTEGRRAGLVGQERPNIFTSEVANIPPGEKIIVELEYQQLLQYDQGRFSFRVPTVVAPRYIPGRPSAGDGQQGFAGTGWANNTTLVPDAARITPPVDLTGRENNPVSIQVKLDPGIPLLRIESPYHPIEQTRDAQGIYHIRLAAGQVAADRDFELAWFPKPGAAPQAALFHEHWRGQDYGMIMVMAAPGEQTEVYRQRREVVFVVDTSGSMHGASIDQAGAALLMAIERLQPEDRFNLIEFNHVTRSLFPKAVVASPRHRQQALAHVRGLTANGGTEMLPAIEAALETGDTGGYLRQVIFLTDGSVGNERQLFETIQRQLGSSRLFTIGIGSAPNSYFMTRAAAIGRGSFTYIGDVNEVQTKMSALFRKLEHPALKDIRVTWPEGVEVEMWPASIPDLYVGEPLMVTARMPGLQGDLLIEATLNGAPWQHSVRLQGGAAHPGIHGLWGRRKIASLMAEHKPGAVTEALRAQVIGVALEHRLVSRYTSLVAVDKTPVRPQQTALKTGPVPVNLPSGWSAAKVFGVLPQTATSAPLSLLLGLVFLLLSGWLRYRLAKQS